MCLDFPAAQHNLGGVGHHAQKGAGSKKYQDDGQHLAHGGEGVDIAVAHGGDGDHAEIKGIDGREPFYPHEGYGAEDQDQDNGCDKEAEPGMEVIHGMSFWVVASAERRVRTAISPGQLKRSGAPEAPTPRLVKPCMPWYCQNPLAVKRGALLLV